MSNIKDFLGGSGGFPTGCVIDYEGITAPDGWLMCDGSIGDKAVYPELAAILPSNTGIDAWTVRSLPTEYHGSVYDLCFGNGLWVIVGSDKAGAGEIMTSPDGITWTRRGPSDGPVLRSVLYANGLWVVVGNTGTLLTSLDGITWTERESGTTTSMSILHYADGLWFAGYGNGCITSTDGITWEGHNVVISAFAVNHADGLWVAVGYGGRISSSPDGKNWTERTSNVTDGLYAVQYGNGLWVAKGHDIVSSPDGINWTKRMSFDIGGNPQCLQYGNGLWVAVDTGIATSPDGINWTIVKEFNQSATATAVLFADGLWVVGGANSGIHTSDDGVAWKFKDYPTGHISRIHQAENQWLAVAGSSLLGTFIIADNTSEFVLPHIEKKIIKA